MKPYNTSVWSIKIMTLMTEDYTLDKLAKEIKATIRGSYRLSLVQQDSVNIVLRLLDREIRSLEKIIKETDQAIEDMVEILPEYQCLTSVPGIGKVFAAGIGQLERFKDHPQVAKYVGLNWKETQSGTTSSQNT